MISKDMVYRASRQLREMVEAAAHRAMAEGALPEHPLPDFAVEIPGDCTHGDFAVNLAMAGAKVFRMPAAAAAAAILGRIDFAGSFFGRAEIAGPGFLNFFLDKSWFAQVLESVAELGDRYGHTNYGQGRRVMVEFVSANPTGPMHMGNARGGAIGDGLASAMEAAGYDVTREFYINDAGNQVEKFALSLEARYLQLFLGEDQIPFPEDGYQGEDIRDRAREFAGHHGDSCLKLDPRERRDALVAYALPRNITALREDLLTYRIHYESWFNESSLYADGTVALVVDKLTRKGLTYEKAGALWYKATEYGAEKDEVLIRQNGNSTYFAADIAYHYNKFVVRGFERVIDIWGADHHGHVARLKGALDALGLDGGKLDIVLMQLVRLVKDKQPYKMSKRSGRSVTLTDLLELVPIDVARFFFNMREPGSALDFDLDLAVEQSSQNPVYYVQYAHARICSIVKKLEEEGVALRACTPQELELLQTPEEQALIRHIARLPGEIVRAAQRYDPAGLTHYVIDLATLFHKFYTNCRVKGERDSLLQARLNLCVCARAALANTLTLLKISAPESM